MNFIFDSDLENLLHLDPDINLNINENCSTFTIDEFNLKFNQSSQNYSLYNHNLQSFHAKSANFVSYLEAIDHKFHSIVITETWNSPTNVNLCHLDNYSAVHTFRQPNQSQRGGPGGGVSIFCDNNLYRMKKIDDLCFCNETIESCVAEIFCINDSSKNHVIVAVYRPHTNSIEDFTDQLSQILNHHMISNKAIILAGDMNADISATNSSSINYYLNNLSSLYFIPVITKPTKFTFFDSSITSTTLDHIFINKISLFQSAVLTSDVSDHCGTAIIFDEKIPTVINNTPVSFRPFNEKNLENFEHKLIETDWSLLLETENVDVQFNNFVDYIDKLYCECFPIKIKQMSAKRRANPWVSDETLEKIRQKSKYLKFLKCGLISKLENNMFKNRLAKEIQQAKQNYYSKLFTDAKQNLKKSWKTLHSLLGNQNNKKNNIFHDANSPEEKVGILNNFNSFFATIGRNLASKFDDTGGNRLAPNLPHLVNSFYLFPTSENEIMEIILKLKNNKTNLNSVPVVLFKKIAPIIVSPLKKLIEKSFQTGIFPETLKIARITPLHKAGDFSDPSNYRPISSLPFYSKIYEKLMANRILAFCKKISIISPSQFGFQPSVSVSDALVMLTETIYQSFNEKKHHAIALIDIKKAFDSVDHTILLKN